MQSASLLRGPSSATPLVLFVLCLCSAALPTALTAQTIPQCDLIDIPIAPFPGPSGTTLALLPLPNGDLIAGGEFLYADQHDVQYLGRWNGVQWLPFAPLAGANRDVTCLLRAPNGDIYAGGMFTSIGSVPANRIARYDGLQWHALGNGVDNHVRSLCITSTGDLIVGGDFVTGSGLQLNHIARWDGQSWAAFGGGVSSTQTTVSHIAEHGNGDIVIGGNFIFVGGITTPGLARWNGTAWAGCGTPAFPWATVHGMVAQANGDIAALVKISDMQLVVWDGSTLQTQSVLTGAPTSLAEAANGDMLVGGQVSAPGLNLERLIRWNGSTWASMGLPDSADVRTIAIGATGDAFIGGRSSVPSISSNISQWNGSQWTSIGAANATPDIAAFQRMPNGDLIACGSFTEIEGVAANNIARFDGSTWQPMGTGLDDAGTKLSLAGSDLIVSGDFTQVDGVPASRIARWDGSSWSALGSGLLASPFALAGHDDGQVYASFLGAASALAGPLLRWDGSAWLSVPTGGGAPAPGQMIFDLAVMANGTLVVCTSSQGLAGLGTIRTFDGTAWQFLGSPGGQFATQVMVVPDGSIYAVVAPGGVTLWDGISWDRFGGVSVLAQATLANGQFVAAGSFTGVGTGVVSWTGGNWKMLAATSGESVKAIGASGYGDLFLRGGFDTVNELVANGYSRAIAPCPATTTVFGTGCAGSNGQVTLTTLDRAWAGTTVDLTTAGATSSSLVLQVLGFTETTVALPFGAAGCTLDVAPDVIELLLPTAGEASLALSIPSAPSLVGMKISAQGVVLELSASLAIQQSASSNGLRLRIGTL